MCHPSPPVLVLLALAGTPAWAAPDEPPAAPPLDQSPPPAPAGTTPAPLPPAPVPPPPPAPAKPEPKAVLWGRAQLIVGLDPQNQGDVPDVSVVPDGALIKEWNASLQANAALGGKFTYPQPIAGFTAAGQVTAVLYVRRIFTVTNAGFTLDHPATGVKIGVGRFIQPTVNTLTPSVFQFSAGWGNLIHETTGAYVAKQQGRLVLQIGAGRPDADLFVGPILATPRANPRLPFLEGRVAYIDPGIVGELPSNAVVGARPGPLTLSVSGAIGQQRVGVGEKPAVLAIAPAAVDPVIEDLPSWLISAEAIVPLGRLVVMGEWYVGKGANAYVGAVRQRPHVDVATGRHAALGSRGGWLQLSYALPERWSVVAVGGLEHITGGLAAGVPVDGAPRIRVNRLVAMSLSKSFARLHAGVQVQHQVTRYDGLEDGQMVSVLLESSVDF
jgi:hypothetical protein